MSNALSLTVAAIGDAEDPATWSGIPYHFLQAARAQGMDAHGLGVDLRRARGLSVKVRWALGRAVRLGAPKGLQYSEVFLKALWRTAQTPPRDDILLNCSQIFPRYIVEQEARRVAFFLDQTLDQLFDYYEYGLRTPTDVQRNAKARERAQYARAGAIIMQSGWAAQSVVVDYGIDPAKVHVVIPGANIDPALLAGWDAANIMPRLDRAGPLRLGFVGKDWVRKGLSRLIRAVSIARSRGADVEVHVVGPDPQSMPSQLRDAPGVHWVGFIDKRATPDRMIEFLDSIDIGCLLSAKEAGGFSLLEFARLGIPTIAPATGGAPEYTVAGASSLFAADAADEQIADTLVELARDRHALAIQRRAAWDGRLWADWSRCIGEVRVILEQIP